MESDRSDHRHLLSRKRTEHTTAEVCLLRLLISETLGVWGGGGYSHMKGRGCLSSLGVVIKDFGLTLGAQGRTLNISCYQGLV